MRYAEAGETALWLVGFAFLSLCLVFLLNRRPPTL